MLEPKPEGNVIIGGFADLAVGAWRPTFNHQMAAAVASAAAAVSGASGLGVGGGGGGDGGA